MCRLFASCCCKKEETEATPAFDDDIEDARVGNQRYSLFCFSFELGAILAYAKLTEKNIDHRLKTIQTIYINMMNLSTI